MRGARISTERTRPQRDDAWPLLWGRPVEGKIVAVDRNVDKSIAALRTLAPNPQQGMVIEVTHPVVDVIR